jgi:sialidase-1
MAGFVRFSTVQTAGRNRLLFSNPDNLTRADGKPTSTKDRRNLTIKLSYDEGKTWPVKRSLEPGPAGYSDLAVTPDGTILCFYEASRDGVTGGSSERLLLARFNLQWVAPEDADSTHKGNQ